MEIIINQSNRQMNASKVLGDELIRMGVARSVDAPAPTRAVAKQTYNTRHLEAKKTSTNPRGNGRNARPKQFGK